MQSGNDNNDLIAELLSKVKMPEIKLSIPIVPAIDISNIDTSTENVEFEDQIIFGLVKRAFDSTFGKVFEVFEKVSSILF